jgi:predicted acyl esterase
MVQVQSTWFPLVNRNPQTFVDVNQAAETDYRKATQRVYRSVAAPSLVRLNVLPR